MRAGALGDLLLLRPAVAALRAAGHEVGLLAPPGPGAALVGAGPAEVSRLLSWDDPEIARLIGGGEVPPRLDAALAGFDHAVAYTRSAETIAGLRRVVPQVTPWDPQPGGSGHGSRWLAAAVADITAGVPSRVPLLAFGPEETAEAGRRTAPLPDRFVAVHPGSGSRAKNWPIERFLDLAARRAAGRRWLLVLGPAEEGLAPVPDALVAREWPVRVLGAALARAGVFVGNDSGVSHLAAAAGAPTVALFGPTDPAVWAPVGDVVTIVQAPGSDLSALDVETVLASSRR